MSAVYKIPSSYMPDGLCAHLNGPFKARRLYAL